MAPASVDFSDAAHLDTVRAYYRELSYGTFTVEAEVFGPVAVDSGVCASYSDERGRAGAVRGICWGQARAASRKYACS